jgi:hypothetical protein
MAQQGKAVPTLQALPIDTSSKTQKQNAKAKENKKQDSKKRSRAPTPAPSTSGPAPSPVPALADTGPTPGVPPAASLGPLSTPRNSKPEVDENGFTLVTGSKHGKSYANAAMGAIKSTAANMCATFSSPRYDNAHNVQTSSSEDTTDSQATHNRFQALLQINDPDSDDEEDESPPADSTNVDTINDPLDLVDVPLDNETVEQVDVPTIADIVDDSVDGQTDPDATSQVKDQAE